MSNNSFVLKVIESCQTQDQLNSAEQWVMRLIQQNFPKPDARRRMVATILIAALERRFRYISSR